jgi:hypothetical protein
MRQHQSQSRSMVFTSLLISNLPTEFSLGNQDSASSPKPISKTNPNPSLSQTQSSTKLPPTSSSPTMVTESCSSTLLKLKTHKSFPSVISILGTTIKINFVNFAQTDAAHVLMQTTAPLASRKIPSTLTAITSVNLVLQSPTDAKSALTTPRAQIVTLSTTSTQPQTQMTTSVNVLPNSTPKTRNAKNAL